MVLPGLLLWFTLLPSGLEQLLVLTVLWPPVSHGGFWKNFLFYVPLRRAVRTWKSGLCLCPRIFQSFGVWVLPVEYVVFSGRVCCLVQQWFYNLREALEEFHIFSTCGDFRPEAFSLHFLQNGEVCTVDASSCGLSQRGSHFESGHYLYELSSGQTHCVSVNLRLKQPEQPEQPEPQPPQPPQPPAVSLRATRTVALLW